jgi:hypothetical protein
MLRQLKVFGFEPYPFITWGIPMREQNRRSSILRGECICVSWERYGNNYVNVCKIIYPLGFVI